MQSSDSFAPTLYNRAASKEKALQAAARDELTAARRELQQALAAVNPRLRASGTGGYPLRDLLLNADERWDEGYDAPEQMLSLDMRRRFSRLFHSEAALLPDERSELDIMRAEVSDGHVRYPLDLAKDGRYKDFFTGYVVLAAACDAAFTCSGFRRRLLKHLGSVCSRVIDRVRLTRALLCSPQSVQAFVADPASFPLWPLSALQRVTKEADDTLVALYSTDSLYADVIQPLRVWVREQARDGVGVERITHSKFLRFVRWRLRLSAEPFSIHRASMPQETEKLRVAVAASVSASDGQQAQSSAPGTEGSTAAHHAADDGQKDGKDRQQGGQQEEEDDEIENDEGDDAERVQKAAVEMSSRVKAEPKEDESEQPDEPQAERARVEMRTDGLLDRLGSMDSRERERCSVDVGADGKSWSLQHGSGALQSWPALLYEAPLFNLIAGMQSERRESELRCAALERLLRKKDEELRTSKEVMLTESELRSESQKRDSELRYAALERLMRETEQQGGRLLKEKDEELRTAKAVMLSEMEETLSELRARLLQGEEQQSVERGGAGGGRSGNAA